MTRRAIILSFALLALSLTSSAAAQTNTAQSTQHVQVDTSSTYSLSIEELEMMMPEKRLKPEETSEVEAPVESPFSHDASKKLQASSVRALDPRELEEIEVPNEASDTPSR